MSKQKSSQAKRQRFSGPELADLLKEVVTEHGPSAAIAEVNKVRAGGVAGFFCREEFEVIVDSRAASASKHAASSPTRAKTRSLGQTKTSVTDTTPDDINDARFRAALLRRLDKTSEAEASMARWERTSGRTPKRASHTIEIAAEPIDLVTLPPTDPDQAEEDQSPNQIPERNQRRRPAERGPEAPSEPELLVEAVPEPESRSAAVPEPDGGVSPDLPTIRTDEPSVEAPAPEPEMAMQEQRPDPDLSFWSRLVSAQADLHAFLPRRVGLTVVVGPLACAMPVVRRLQCEDHLDPDDVVVLTTRAEIVSEPSWNLVRQDRQLVEAALRSETGSKLLVVDVAAELPTWVAPLIDRLRTAGIDLVRYVVPGSPAPDDLLTYWAGPDDPYVVDLVSRLDPDRLMRLIEHGHPIATIAGVGLSAALLMAMRGAGHDQ